jgi:hypothetical protein
VAWPDGKLQPLVEISSFTGLATLNVSFNTVNDASEINIATTINEAS